MGKPELAEIVREEMHTIDAILIEAQVPIRDRTLKAACIFVECCILEVKGATKENMFLEPWFKTIYQAAQSWYQEKYGSALERATPDALLGACVILGAPFALKVPRTLTRVQKEGETAWLLFPVDVQEDEDPLSWIVQPPNLQALEGKQELSDEVAEIGTLLRTINVNLMTVEVADPVCAGLSSNVATHLGVSAEHIVESRRRTLGLACWEAHQAVEKALKLFIRHSGGAPHKTHDLVDLNRQAGRGATPAQLLTPTVVSRIPGHQRIIEIRTSEGLVEFEEAYQTYMSALQLVSDCVAAIPRKVTMRNARFLLKKPPWLE